MKFDSYESQIIHSSKKHFDKYNLSHLEELKRIRNHYYGYNDDMGLPLLAESIMKLCFKIWDEKKLDTFNPINFVFAVQPGGMYNFINEHHSFSKMDDPSILKFFKQDYWARIISYGYRQLYQLQILDDQKQPIYEIEEMNDDIFRRV